MGELNDCPETVSRLDKSEHYEKSRTEIEAPPSLTILGESDSPIDYVFSTFEYKPSQPYN